MTDIKSYVEMQANLVNERLQFFYYQFRNSPVADAMIYSLKNGGKRIRPFLCLEFSKACGGNLEAALDFACAVEMIHTYSLIHDDLPCMDDDDMRRGKPSCHIAFGEANALLAGDGLLTEAFSVLSRVVGISSDNKISSIKTLASCAGINGMIEGQSLDMQFEKLNPNESNLITMYTLKTSNLLRASTCLGCMTFDNYTDEMIRSARDYAFYLGLAFQIQDDILDITSDEATLGKPVGSDEKNEKSTIIKFYGLEKAKEMVSEYTQKAIDALKDIDGDTTTLKEFALYMANRTY